MKSKDALYDIFTTLCYLHVSVANTIPRSGICHLNSFVSSWSRGRKQQIVKLNHVSDPENIRNVCEGWRCIVTTWVTCLQCAELITATIKICIIIIVLKSRCSFCKFRCWPLRSVECKINNEHSNTNNATLSFKAIHPRISPH